MNQQRIREILAKIENVTVAVYGDFCLDAYWMLDPKGSEVSEETGLRARAVAKHYYSLGGASNVVANLAALKPKKILVIGVIGDDIFGRELRRQFAELGVDTTRLVIQREGFDTVAFGKPYLECVEEPRIDFGFFNQRSAATDRMLLDGIRHALQTADAMIANQQVPGSITNESFIEGANRLFDEFPNKVVLLDSRHFGDKFKHIYRKTNDREAARLNDVQVGREETIPLEDIRRYAQNLYRQFNKPVFLTRGARGILTVDGAGVHEVPGIQLLKKLDPVGAGDTVTGALALCLGAGVPPAEAAEFANFSAAVTVQKLFQTGTANGPEILAVAQDPDFIYRPELAEDRRKARYIPGTEIEVCDEGSFKFEVSSLKSPNLTLHTSDSPIRHAVFDSDGTISTLRQGWEPIMAQVCIKAILGDCYQTADEGLYRKVQDRVLEYIDKSTGVQTLVQMEALTEMVREFGLVPPDKVLDRFGYKRIYNDALMETVSERIARLRRGQLETCDFTVKGAVEFARALRERGVTLYLASGTDHADVVAESTALGYAELFNGGIYGAVGDMMSCSKKMVIDRIMTEHNLRGPELAVFGDGPVELRESRKRDGLAIGIASDEVRRHGLNLDKRARLVKAGAHLIVPDFSQKDPLLGLLLKG
ncbi:MAG: carbohydrate kinase [Planctomycetes bacterium RBG_13_62_9]|nr:MAG: carbohydrate kinase [Planctomycetes bacterium RBG_13_62_9]